MRDDGLAPRSCPQGAANGVGAAAGLNQIYVLARLQTNFFSPCQKLIKKTRVGAKVTKRDDTAQTPYQRAMPDSRVTNKVKTALTREYKNLNPAQIHRDILDLQDHLLNLVRAQHRPARLPVKPPAPTRASTHGATGTECRPPRFGAARARSHG